MDTNNYIESWHFHLKSKWLRLMRQQRVDHLIYILSNGVILHYQRMSVSITLGFVVRRRDKAEEVRYRRAYAVPAEDGEAMVRAGAENNTVSSSMISRWKSAS